MRIAITGSSGLVGSALRTDLARQGHEPVPVRRITSDSPDTGPRLDTTGGPTPPGDYESIDAVVHLAGEGIASRRWTAEQKRKIRDSRVLGTRSLSEALAACESPPKTLVCASAIGFYGDRGSEELDESSEKGSGFLADTCAEWEDATTAAREAGIRVVNLRIGFILSTEGGALPKMLTPFKLFAGGKIGSGDQYISWILLEDLVRSITFCLEQDDLSGPVNGVAPLCVDNSEFTRQLGEVLRRPTIFPLPAFMARIIVGEMADELLLAGQRVRPGKLEKAGFEWNHRELGPALRSILRP